MACGFYKSTFLGTLILERGLWIKQNIIKKLYIYAKQII